MAGKYSLQCLNRIKDSVGKARLADPLWQRLKDFGLTKFTRGTRGGVGVQRPITTWINNRTSVLNHGIINGFVNVNNLAPCPTVEMIKVLCSNRTSLKEVVSSFCNSDNLIKISCDVEKDSALCRWNAQSVTRQRISLN